MPAIKIEAKCPAKINLTFDIKGMLEDGYHKVETLYQAVSIYDQLVFTCYLGSAFAVKINATGSASQQFPPAQDNIIYKAAEQFRQNLPKSTDFRLEAAVKKNIPIGAGLGGASSNAAATLMVLNTMFDKPFSTEDLVVIAAAVGADVPFFITGGLCLGTFRGDRLQPLEPLLQLWLVIVKPKEISVQTSWAYACFDKFAGSYDVALLPKPDWHAVNEGLQIDKLGNVFELPIFEHYPVLANLRNAVESAGATCCHMTGSGSALYGLATSKEHAHSIADKLSRQWSNHINTADIDIFIAQAIEHGVQLGEISETQEKVEQTSSRQHAV